MLQWQPGLQHCSTALPAGDDGSALQASVVCDVVIDVRKFGWRNLLLMLVDKVNVQFYTST